MKSKNFFVIFLLLYSFGLVSCVQNIDTNNAHRPIKFSSLNPVTSNEMDFNKQKLKMIDKKIEKIDAKINSYYEKLNSIDMELNSVLGMGGNPFEKKIGGDLRSVYTPPHRDVENLNNDRIYVINKINDLEKEKKALLNEKASILNESTKTCFSKDTIIKLANGSLKKISEVKKGDEIISYDFMTDQFQVSEVNKVFINKNNHFYVINDKLKITAFERFLTNKGWKRAIELKVGDFIFDGNKFEKISSIQKIRGKFIVYNLNVEKTHNFFVSADGNIFYIVHNCGGGGGK